MEVELSKVKRKAKRLGRGRGSNKGKTSGRGMNGQRSRSGAATRFLSGGQTKIYMGLPKISGFKSRSNKNRGRIIINFDYILDNFKKDELINLDKIKNILGENSLRYVKVIAGKKKIEKRKFDDSIMLSESIRKICGNS